MSTNNLMPTRRTVMRTAVWTAPAVSLAVAAPAFAANTSNTIPVAPVGSPSSSLASSNDKNAVVVSTVMSSSRPISGTITATVQVTVTKSSGNALAEATVSINDGVWTGPSGTPPTFQMTDLPSGQTTFAPTVTLGAGSWDSFYVLITVSGPGFSFNMEYTYVKP